MFLHLDHSWTPEGPPVLFETMAFGGRHDQVAFRAVTQDEALETHRQVVAAYRNSGGQTLSSRPEHSEAASQLSTASSANPQTASLPAGSSTGIPVAALIFLLSWLLRGATLLTDARLLHQYGQPLRR